MIELKCPKCGSSGPKFVYHLEYNAMWCYNCKCGITVREFKNAYDAGYRQGQVDMRHDIEEALR